MDSDKSSILINVSSAPSKGQHRIISKPFHSQRFSPNTDWDKRIIPATETGLNFIGDIGRPLNHWGGTNGGIRAIPGIIDDGSANLPPPTTAVPSSSGTIDPSEARKRRKSTNPSAERRIHQLIDQNSDDSTASNWKSKHRTQQRAHEGANLSDEEDETDDDKLDSNPRLIENRADSGLVHQTTSKRRKLTRGHTREQPPQQLRALLPREEFSAGITTRPLSNIESETSLGRVSNATDRGSEGYRRLGDTYSIGDTRQYLRCYITYIYPRCPLELCDDSVEDLVIDTLRKTDSNTEQSQMIVLCVYSMLALGARYAMHVERAREFFLSARERLAHLPEGEIHELRLAEGLNCMAMYAMGVESSVEVLGYLNRALDICAINGAVNGPVITSCLHWKHLLILARIDEVVVDSTEETRIALRERAWLWFKDAYERPKETAPYVVSRIKDATYPVSLAAMRTIDNCISVMVRITSGIVALGWGWQDWKQLPPNSDAQTKEVILGQHLHWLQWLDRVMARVNETQPLGDEIPEVIVTDLRLNLYALYAGCYLAVDMNDSALQWAIRYVRELRQTVFRQSGNLLFADMDVIFRVCETMKCEHLLDDVSLTLGTLVRSIPSVVFLKRRCDRLRAGLQRQRSDSLMPADSLAFTRRKDLLSFASPLISFKEQLIPLDPDDCLSEPQQQQQQQQPPPLLLQPHPTHGRLNPLPSLRRYPPHHWSHEEPPYLHPSPAAPDTLPSTITTATPTTQQASQTKPSSHEVKKDRDTSNEKKEPIPTTTTTTTTTTTSLLPPPNILAQLQHLQRQIEHQHNTATAANENYGEKLNTHKRNNTDPTSGRPPSRLGKSDIHDLIHHDADEHKREGPAQQDDAGVRGASTQDGGELGERRCLECNCTGTPEWRKGPGGPHTLCNACGLRWSRSALNLKKKGPFEEQLLFAKFSISRKIT